MPTRLGLLLPQKKNVLYTLRTELIETDGTVSDSIMSIVYVPSDTINATLTTDKEVYSSDETVVLTVSDLGPMNLSFGVMYLIEKEDNGAWVPIQQRLELDIAGL
ncbi:immunoglobulin-like domain-containing protein [Cohnella luojiensis]|uniref:Bacterial Ig-like domain-containing protein n=1 Tax=Cohnella luojiensis TaxID=652876 RepID=A0A4Y8LVV5_9BACL|nr:immunoglobulin-like domain-containing protein [Cohnella luojiensis]TFE25168.1 hypothetical protein E2980_14020 [Cohnella luojiensis]